MPGRGGNWKSKSEKRAAKKTFQDFSRSAKRVLDYEPVRKPDDPFCTPRKGRPLEKSLYNSHWINKKKKNRQNRDDEAGWGTRHPKEKYLKAWLNENSIIDPIPEDEACDYEETVPLRRPLPRTLESFMPADQHERRQPDDDDDTILRLAIAMSLQESKENQERTENENLQEALLLSIRDATPTSSWQDVGGSEQSALTATWQEVTGGSELSVPVSVNSWVDVPTEVPAINSQNVDGSRNASPGTDQSWSLIES